MERGEGFAAKQDTPGDARELQFTSPVRNGGIRGRGFFQRPPGGCALLESIALLETLQQPWLYPRDERSAVRGSAPESRDLTVD